MATFQMAGEGNSTAPQQPRRNPGYRPGTRQYTAIPEGTELLCDVVSVELRDKPEWKLREDRPDDTKEVSFRVRVNDPEHPEYNKRNLFADTPTYWSASPKCKLRNWAQEILAYEGTLQQLDTDELVGRQVRVTVGNRQGRDKEGNTVTKDFIQDLKRVRTGGYPDANEVFSS
jgi:hypothetical protein